MHFYINFNYFLKILIILFKRKYMPKIKIIKKPKEKNKNYKRKISFTPTKNLKPDNKFADEYLKYYTDIKIPSKRYDW